MNNAQTENAILQVPIEDIIPNRFQPRLAFDDASLQDLASSIKQHGIIQPLVLRKLNDKYEIIAGERRYKAARLAGLASVPAVITTMDDNTSAEVAIVENVQRKDLTAIEEAKSYQALLDKGYMTQEELARKMGLSQSAVSNKLRLLTLDESVQEAILQEKISERHARTLLKVANKDTQKELLDRTLKERLTVKQLEEEVRKISGTDSNQLKEEVPVINSEPNINRVVNNAVDITTLNTPSAETLESVVATPETPGTDIFNSPEKMPNKFFNFLEDTAANMDIPDTPFTPEPTPVQPVEEIEMLDFEVPVSNPVIEQKEDSYVSQVRKAVKNLYLDINKATIEEKDLPNEFQITITIKKEGN